MLAVNMLCTAVRFRSYSAKHGAGNMQYSSCKTQARHYMCGSNISGPPQTYYSNSHFRTRQTTAALEELMAWHSIAYKQDYTLFSPFPQSAFHFRESLSRSPILSCCASPFPFPMGSRTRIREKECIIALFTQYEKSKVEKKYTPTSFE